MRRVAIETLYHGLYDGPHATPKPSEDGPVFLGIGNITEDGKLDLHDVRHIAEEDYPSWTKRVTPRPGDIVFTYEATLNRYAIIPEGFRGCLGRRTALIRPNPDAVNSRFLFFYFFCEDWRKTISENILSGATVDRIPLTRFPTFPVTLPERAIQDSIATILSAYDDLIENNTRRIKILEELAQMLYREWFVTFRFPGHQKVKMVESELGPIPEGWNVEPLAEVYKTGSGGTPSRKIPSYYGGAIPWVKTQELQDGFIHNTDEKITEEGLKNSSAKLHPPGAVLMAMYGATIGKLGMLALPATCNQACCALTPKEPHFGSEYIFLALLNRRTDILALRMGAAQQNISQEVIKAFPLMRPNTDVMDRFNETVKPLMALIGLLQAKNSNLRTTRDLLLPKLISGEIPVEAAAELVEQTA